MLKTKYFIQRLTYSGQAHSRLTAQTILSNILSNYLKKFQVKLDDVLIESYKECMWSQSGLKSGWLDDVTIRVRSGLLIYSYIQSQYGGGLILAYKSLVFSAAIGPISLIFGRNVIQTIYFKKSISKMWSEIGPIWSQSRFKTLVQCTY